MDKRYCSCLCGQVFLSKWSFYQFDCKLEHGLADINKQERGGGGGGGGGVDDLANVHAYVCTHSCMGLCVCVHART